MASMYSPEPPPGFPGPAEDQGGPSSISPVEHLRAAIEHAQAALVGEPSDQDSQALAQIVQGLYRILAQREKETQQVMGNPGTQNVIQRALRG